MWYVEKLLGKKRNPPYKELKDAVNHSNVCLKNDIKKNDVGGSSRRGTWFNKTK